MEEQGGRAHAERHTAQKGTGQKGTQEMRGEMAKSTDQVSVRHAPASSQIQWAGKVALWIETPLAHLTTWV